MIISIDKQRKIHVRTMAGGKLLVPTWRVRWKAPSRGTTCFLLGPEGFGCQRRRVLLA